MLMKMALVFNQLTHSILGVLKDIITSPFYIGLLICSIVLIYRFLFYKSASKSKSNVPNLPPMKKRDMTIDELKQYDGTNSDKRICVAVNGKIFDVSKEFDSYGPGGIYAAYAGRDASRSLALFALDKIKEDAYDDLSDFNSVQMEKVKEWELQFREKYIYVGRLIKPGEEKMDYSEDEESVPDQNPPVKESDGESTRTKED